MKRIAILGITGSIGRTALRGCSLYKDTVRIVCASCYSHVDYALSQCIEAGIQNLCVMSEADVQSTNGITIWHSLEKMLDNIKCDIVLNGIGGSPGLYASVAVIRRGIKLALANKESVVLGGRLLFEEAAKYKTTIIPVDSEHSAIDELIITNGIKNIQSLIITASGGPFRNLKESELKNITPQMAAKHPTWNMGMKISIDSATLANKGLEVIEAHYLFGFDADHIEVVIHPQSVVHSMVRTVSGQVYAQMSPPDMVFPIMRAILERDFDRPVGQALSFDMLNLTFEKIDFKKHSLVKCAFDCVREGGISPVVYNTANEIAVDAFIKRKIDFTQIGPFVQDAVSRQYNTGISCLEDIKELQNEITIKTGI